MKTTEINCKSILTKSALVRRDLDLLRCLRDVEVGFTITALDEEVRRVFEPRSSPIPTRLSLLRAPTCPLPALWNRIMAWLPYTLSASGGAT